MSSMKIKAERDSVCMGDDCNAPNTGYLEYDENELLSVWLMKTVTDYVPHMHECVWSVESNRKIIGYLICDKNGNYTVETTCDDEYMGLLNISEIFCMHYYDFYFKGKEYSDCTTLIDKVRKSLMCRIKS